MDVLRSPAAQLDFVIRTESGVHTICFLADGHNLTPFLAGPCGFIELVKITINGREIKGESTEESSKKKEKEEKRKKERAPKAFQA